MSKGLSRSGFDIDLREGEAREAALAKALSKVGYLIEHKSDHKARATGNVFIEYRQKGRPSGIQVTTADFWAIEFDTNAWVILETSRLKWLAREAWKAGRRVVGGDNDQYEGVLVPVAQLTRLDYLTTGTAPATPQPILDRRFAQAIGGLAMDEDDEDLDTAWLRAMERLGLVVEAPEVA